LNAKAAAESAPVVANLMAKQMNKDAVWEKEQVNNFYKIAESYIPATDV